MILLWKKIIPWVAKGLTEKELNAKMREIYKENRM